MLPSLPTRPTKDPDKLSASWLCKLLDCVAYGMANPRGDGKTILNESSGTLRALRQPGGGTDGGASAYAGPFAVVKKDADAVTLLGYNQEAGRLWQNIIDIGAYTSNEYIGLMAVDEQNLDITVENATGGWVYLDIHVVTTGTEIGQIASQYEVTLFFGAFPAQTADHYYHRLAYLTINDGAIADIVQWQYGGIYLPGRVF